MELFRVKLHPRSPWRTPWQADTLTGMVLATCARVYGADVLRDRLIDPMLAGSPPFVLSDACPGDLLPAPMSLRLQQWPAERWKTVKRVRWTTLNAFERLRRGEAGSLDGLLTDDDLILEHARHHNTLSRLTDTSGEAESGLGLFNRPDIHLRTHTGPATPNPALNGADYLSIYFRAADGNATDLLLDLLHELSLTGFGADVATGRGQFEIISDVEPVPRLDAPVDRANAAICLSTFQPGPTDPTDGLWDAFPKFGKLGPDLALSDVRKRTLIMFRPGACFRTPAPLAHLGRAVPMHELLPHSSSDELHRRGIHVIHPAFGLCVPAKLSGETTA